MSGEREAGHRALVEAIAAAPKGDRDRARWDKHVASFQVTAVSLPGRNVARSGHSACPKICPDM